MHCLTLWDFPVVDLRPPMALRYFLRMDTWAWADGLHILLYVDPRTIRDISFRRLDGEEIGEIDAEYEPAELAWRELADLWKSGSNQDRETPTYFVNWALSKKIPVLWLNWAIKEQLIDHSSLGLPLPSGTRDFGPGPHLSFSQPRPEVTPKKAPIGELSTKERESLYKMIVCMAVDCFAYDPRKRTDAVSRIASVMEERGLPLDEDTIRNHLKRAAELLPPTVWR